MCERNSNKQVTSVVGSTISSKLNPKLELDSSQTDDTSIAATSTAVTIHSSNLNKKLVKIKKFKLEDMKEMVGGCCVCSDERGWPENPLVYCDGQNCTVAVHQACYGIVTVPTGPWYCRKCESQERTSRVRCELCPSRDGALKKTDNSGWAHVVCALYIPEVRFGNVTTMEPIILTLIPQERYSKTCYICLEIGKPNRANVGACMQCNKSNCKQQFHVTCAQSLGLLCEEAGNYLDNVKYCGYCQHHYSKLKKGGNVKTIPPYKPIQHDTSSDSCSSPEKEIDSTINAASTSGTSIKITSTTNLGISSVSSINTGGIGSAGSAVSSTKQRKGNGSGKSSSSSSSSSSGSSTGSGAGGGVSVSGTDRPNPSTSSTSGSSAISMTNPSGGTTTFTSTSNNSNLAGNLTAGPASISPSTPAGGPIAASSTTLPSLAATSSSVSSANAATKFSTSASSASSSMYKDKHSKNLNKSSSSKDKEKEGSANTASNNNSSNLSSINSSLSVSGSSLSSASTKSSSKSNKNKDLMLSNATTSITTQSSSTSTIASNSSMSGSNISSSAAGTTSSTSSSLTSSANEHAQNLSTNHPIGGKSTGFDVELNRSGPNPSSMNDSSTSSSYAINPELRDHGLTQRTGTTTTIAPATNLSTSKGLTSSTSTTSLAPTSTSNPSTTSSSSLNSTSKKRKADSIKSSSGISASSATSDENSSFRDIIKDVQVTLTPLTDFEKEIEKTSKRQRTELSPPTHQSSATAEVNATLAPAPCATISTTSATGSTSSSGSTTTTNTSNSNFASGSPASISSNNTATTGPGLPASNFAKSDTSKTIGSGSKHGTNGGIKDTTSNSGSSSSSSNQQQATGANTNAPSLYVSVPLSTANVPGINLPNASGGVTGNGTGTLIDSSQSAIRSGNTPAQPSNQNQSSLGTGNAAYVTTHTSNSLSGTPTSTNASTSASSSSSSSLSALSSSVIQHQHPSGKSSTASALSGGTSGALVSGNCGGNIISSTSTSTTHSSGNLTATTTESGNLKISYEKQTNRVQQLQEQESSPGRRSRTPDLNSGTVSTSAISASSNSNPNSSSFSGLKFTYEAQNQLDVSMLPVSSIKDSPPSSPGSEIGVNPHPNIADQPPVVNTAGAAVGGNVRKRGRKAKDPTLATQAAAQAVADLKDVRILQNGGNNSTTASNSATTIGSPLVPAPTPPATPSISVSASSSSSTSIIAHTATHMLGNHVNPNSSVAQKLSEQLHMEVQDHAIYTPDSMNSQFTGVPFPGKQRNSTTSSSSGNIPNTLVAPNPLQSMFGGGGINGNMPIPQSLEQLLERQWEQGSQFLMEQAQHFDIASLLNCLHQLQSENLRLEEHVTSLIARRDHLLAVNARLQIPLSTISNNAKAEAHGK
ncbi:protein AF-10 isoform X3 [Drosophila tropicalis]|uniref:protein AF-10 isoform X3 n=2 Tax=Drosophila tropicalis TaxID=46794 RepID=UPI0035ABE80D